MTRVILHVDITSAYVSCEAAFDPSIRGRPTIVASNNDGCAIAMNAQAKALGVRMGDPLFKLQPLIRRHGILVFSSNYALYASMSNRFMQLLSGFSPVMEIYSIDEAFLDLTGMPTPYTAIGTEIKNRSWQWLGLPVCVGIGATKTLAKLADFMAKKKIVAGGVCDLYSMSHDDAERHFANIEVGEIWGIGRRLAPRLQAMGILTVLDLRQSDPEFMRQQFGVVMEKTIRELNGVQCLEIEEVAPPKQQVVSSRSFGHQVTGLANINEAITAFVSRAAEKIRRQDSFAGAITVFVQTNRFNDDPKYSASRTVALPAPTNDTLQLTSTALWAVKQIFRPGYRYQKAGVMLSDLMPAAGQQTDLFGFRTTDDKSAKLMLAMDQINSKMGRETLKLGSQGTGRRNAWAMKRERLSPNYLHAFDDLPAAG